MRSAGRPGRRSRRPAVPAVLLLAALVPAACRVAPHEPELVVGSKKFTEAVILGEILSLTLRGEGMTAVHRRELGGTQVLWNALLAGEIDLYVDYTGTIAEEILAGELAADLDALRPEMVRRGVRLGPELGFDNTYALGMREDRASALGIGTVSALAERPQLRFGFSNEFMDRGDGWPALRDAYGLAQTDVRGLDHDLAYRALQAGEIDVIDLYTTDAEISYYGLRVLEDDRGHFPDYRALVLARADLAETVFRALQPLQEAIPRSEMVAMNAAVKIEGHSEIEVAAGFVERRLGLAAEVEVPGLVERLVARGREHLTLVAISLSAAVLLALPLGVLAARRPRLGAVLLGAAGVIQTIPSLALLVIMVPLLGIGAPPAILALFLYSLLPILRNTATGLASLPAPLLESADALGLSRGARLRLVELPLAAPAILAGIKIAAVINVGTATLGALIGAGGYGQPILTGIRLDDAGLILEGAIPAAVLALGLQAVFDLLERVLVPRGLRGSVGS